VLPAVPTDIKNPRVAGDIRKQSVIGLPKYRSTFRVSWTRL